MTCLLLQIGMQLYVTASLARHCYVTMQRMHPSTEKVKSIPPIYAACETVHRRRQPLPSLSPLPPPPLLGRGRDRNQESKSKSRSRSRREKHLCNSPRSTAVAQTSAVGETGGGNCCSYTDKLMQLLNEYMEQRLCIYAIEYVLYDTDSWQNPINKKKR